MNIYEKRYQAHFEKNAGNKTIECHCEVCKTYQIVDKRRVFAESYKVASLHRCICPKCGYLAIVNPMNLTNSESNRSDARGAFRDYILKRK